MPTSKPAKSDPSPMGLLAVAAALASGFLAHRGTQMTPGQVAQEAIGYARALIAAVEEDQ